MTGVVDEGALVERVAKLNQTRALEQCVAAASEALPSVRDRLKAGWLYYYKYKSLYEAKRFEEAYRFFYEMTGPKATALVFTTNNAIWVHSVAMELAWRVKDAPAIDRLAQKAMELAVSQPARVQQIEANRRQLLELLQRAASGG